MSTCILCNLIFFFTIDRRVTSKKNPTEATPREQKICPQESPARYAGCNLAVALLMGNRLVVCTVGACRAVLCTPPSTEPATKKATAAASTANQGWNCRTVEGSIGGHLGVLFFWLIGFLGVVDFWCFFVFFVGGRCCLKHKKSASDICTSLW